MFDIAAALVPRVYDLTSLHRFTDPEYARLTLGLRADRDPAALFDRLHALGMVVLHEDTETLRAAVTAERIDGAAITTATNDEARELNALIREDRVRTGLVDDARTVEGSDGLSIGRGDLIQTRRNDAEVGVANRQTWIVQHVGTDGDLWVRDAASDRKQQRTMHLPAEYVAEHAHLAYAATAYGVQGITAPESHTILSDALDAAGVYVGLTRGREANRLHVVAADLGDARGQFTAALERDRADRGLREATERAKLAVAGVVADGPVREVNDERVRLAERIEDAEKRAAWWSDAAARLDRQAAEHGDAYDAQQAQLAAAREQMEAVRAAVVAPLVEAATADAATLMDAKDQEREADAARRAAGRLRRRGAERIRIAAEQDRTVIETAVRDRWGWAPSSAERVPAWAEAVAGRHADADPQVVEAGQAAERAEHDASRLAARQMSEREQLRRAIYRDPYSRASAKTRAEDYTRRAAKDRRLLAQIEALPPGQGAALIRERAEAERIAAAALAERAAQLRTAARDPHRPSPNTRPDLGPSL